LPQRVERTRPAAWIASANDPDELVANNVLDTLRLLKIMTASHFDRTKAPEII
jgi:hypothetical protein